MVSYPQWTWLYIIMNIGNELYSGLSRHSYLLSAEVSEMIIAFNINYQFQCNPSYTGTYIVLVKYKISKKKDFKKESYAQMEPAMKKQVLSNKAI